MVLPSSSEILGHTSDLLLDQPFIQYLGIREKVHDGVILYLMDFREQHVGNPMIQTFHGGILASFGEVVAGIHLARHRQEKAVVPCFTMTFDYLRPAFAGTLSARPNIVRSGRRIATVSVQLYQDDQLVCIGRYFFS